MLTKIADWIKSLNVRDFIFTGVIILLCGCLLFSVNKCSNIDNRYQNNIKALTDTISYYESKTGSLIATKTAYESDIKELKDVNVKLYQDLEDMKIKNKTEVAINFSGEIVNENPDTIFIVKQDTIYKGFNHGFDFSNNWRELSGVVTYKPDSLQLRFDKDIIKFDYTIAMDKNNQIYIKSENPYVRFNEMTGFTLPKQRTKRWGLSITVGYGCDIQHNKFGPTLSLGISWDIVQW